MKKLIYCFLISSFFSSLNASSIFYNPYFVLIDGKVVKAPETFFLKQNSITIWLINYNKNKKIKIKDIHRIQKVQNKNEAILYMKNNDIFKIKFSFNMILKANKNITSKKISEIVFN